MKKILIFSCIIFLQGCSIFGNPDYSTELEQIKKNVKLFRQDYEPIKKDGKILKDAAMRPFDDQEKNEKFRKTAIDRVDKTVRMIDKMLEGY